jgi:hypothetical protein
MRLLKNLYALTGPAFGLLSHVYAVHYSGGHGYLRVDGCENILKDNFSNILLALPSR